ncbi:MAG: hypothetical protein WCP82_10310 [Alphaproteobacteria bacterium]
MMFSRSFVHLLAVFGLLWMGQPAHALPHRVPDQVLTGTLTGADHETYREVAFEVPAGTKRLTVDFAYTGREDKTTVDLGLRDPQRFRGWSGGNKSQFTVSASDSTPSYLSGPLPAGTWSWSWVYPIFAKRRQPPIPPRSGSTGLIDPLRALATDRSRRVRVGIAVIFMSIRGTVMALA